MLQQQQQRHHSKPKLEINARVTGTEDMKDWCRDKKSYSSHGTSGALYFVGFVGALVYWMQAAVGFGAVVTGFLKALVWPAYIVYKLLENFYGVVL
jgi:hypothetical protein